MVPICSRRKDKRVIAAAGDVLPVALTADQYCQRYQIARHTLRKAADAGLVIVHRFGPKTVRYADAPPRAE